MSAGGHLIRNRIGLREGVDLNSLTVPGIYSCDEPTNAPDTSKFVVSVTVATDGTTRQVLQIANDLSDGAASVRVFDGTDWSAWTELGGGGGGGEGGEANLSLGDAGEDADTVVQIDNDNGTGVQLPAATTEVAGVMTAADKTLLDALDSDGPFLRLTKPSAEPETLSSAVDAVVNPIGEIDEAGDYYLSHTFSTLTNNSASGFDLNPPVDPNTTGTGSLAAKIINGADAGVIGLDAWDAVTGDEFTTDEGDVFMCVGLGIGDTWVLNVTRIPAA